MALAVEDQIALNGSHPTLGHVQAQISAAQRLLAAHTVAAELTPQQRSGFLVPPGFRPMNPLLPGPMLDFPPGTRLDPNGSPISRYAPPGAGAGYYNPNNPNPPAGGGGGLIPYAFHGETEHMILPPGQGTFPFSDFGSGAVRQLNPAVEAARRILNQHREPLPTRALA